MPVNRQVKSEHAHWWRYYSGWNQLQLKDELMAGNIALNKPRVAVIKALLLRKERLRKKITAIQTALRDIQSAS